MTTKRKPSKKRYQETWWAVKSDYSGFIQVATQRKHLFRTAKTKIVEVKITEL